MQGAAAAVVAVVVVVVVVVVVDAVAGAIVVVAGCTVAGVVDSCSPADAHVARKMRRREWERERERLVVEGWESALLEARLGLRAVDSFAERSVIKSRETKI